MDNEILEILKEMGSVIGGRLDNLEQQGDALETALAISQSPGGGGISTGHLSDFTNGKGYALLGPKDNKSYQALFGNQDTHPWTDKENSFFQAVFSGRHHPGLVQASAMTEGGNAGFLVPTEQTAKIHAVSLENELVLPRCFLQPMRSNELKIPAMSIGDHGSNLYGGFTASYTAETGTISEKNPKTRQIDLIAKKLTGLLRFSNELAADIPGGEKQLVDICGKGLAWYRDKAFLKGTGAGTPLGILNADCTVVVDKETGQGADTIVYHRFSR